jgi:phage-related protein
MKPLSFRGRALDDLRAFPEAARREAGYQLDKLQNEQKPIDWKPMPSIGKGVEEIRLRDEAGAFRVIDIARFADAVHVLHCFQKKSQKTIKTDLEQATRRYNELLKELNR